MIPAQEALTRLKEGNRRFVAGRTSGDDGRPRDLSGGQAPMAAILGCSDSRVPAEIVFDQGPGDLFIVRVAGNIASPTQIGSIEFAASVLGTRLVVVLGHQECGAVEAALEQLRAPISDISPHLEEIVEHVRPALRGLSDPTGKGDPEALLQRAVHANVMTQTEKLRDASTILQRLEREQGLMIVSATYSLRDCEVDFWESG
jgi:carbonic anhydrase